MLRSDSNSSYTGHQGSGDAADAAASAATGSVPYQQEGVSDFGRAPWLHQAPPYDLSQMDDNLLSCSESQVSNNTWLHLAGPFDLALLNDNLLSAQDCVSVSYMCQANPIFLPQITEQPSAVFGSAAVWYICQANPLYVPVVHGGDKLSAVNASTAIVSDAFLHRAALTNMDRTADMDHSLLAFSGSKVDMVAWLHLAPPFDLAALDHDLLSGISSKTNTLMDAWLHQAPPFDLAAMDDELLAGIITGAAAA
jgi:hypothetical protein